MLIASPILLLASMASVIGMPLFILYVELFHYLESTGSRHYKERNFENEIKRRENERDELLNAAMDSEQNYDIELMKTIKDSEIEDKFKKINSILAKIQLANSTLNEDNIADNQIMRAQNILKDLNLYKQSYDALMVDAYGAPNDCGHDVKRAIHQS